MHQATFEDAGQQGERPRRERDPAMRQTRKGQQWHFGMKAHIGSTWIPG